MHGPGHSFLNEKLYFMSGAEPSSLVRAYSEQRREKNVILKESYGDVYTVT